MKTTLCIILALLATPALSKEGDDRRGLTFCQTAAGLGADIQAIRHQRLKTKPDYDMDDFWSGVKKDLVDAPGFNLILSIGSMVYSEIPATYTLDLTHDFILEVCLKKHTFSGDTMNPEKLPLEMIAPTI